MASAQEFYDYADEHFGWAGTAKTERERAIFLQMTHAWLEAAQKRVAAKDCSMRCGPRGSDVARPG
jgi:hypothetical protein